MTNWEVGNFNVRGKLQKRRKGCKLELGPKQYGVIVDSNAYNATEPESPMTVFIKALEDAGICVYESPFVFIGNRLVDNPGDDPSAVDSGSDRVVISDENGLTVVVAHKSRVCLSIHEFVIGVNRGNVLARFVLLLLRNYLLSNVSGSKPVKQRCNSSSSL